MSTPYIGEIRLFAGTFAPVGWSICDGSLLAISQNEALFNLIGTTYGGDGQNTFALPDLRGRVPVHQGSNLGVSFVIGQQAGTEQVTLTPNQVSAHTHEFVATAATAVSTSPAGERLAASSGPLMYGTTADAGTSVAIKPVGGSQPHENLMPFLCVSYIISLFGIFPTQN